jgi:protein-S-isoprenylcysteine O-methyltransferase Ste14
MYWFLMPLVIGFSSNLASAFTAAYSEKWGKGIGTFITIILRNITGIPVWATGFLMAIRDSSGLVSETSAISQIIGLIIILSGAVIIVIALVTIRVKAAAPSTGDRLVRKGIYSIVRHPIHCGTFLEFAGLFILWQTLPVGIAAGIGFIWIFLQTGFEEYDLKRRIPEYTEYMKQVPRFIPSFHL